MTLPECLIALHVDLQKAIAAYDEGENKALAANLQHIRDMDNNALMLVEKELSKMKEQNTDS